MQQTSCYGVFNSHQAYYRFVTMYVFEHLFEGRTAYQFYLFCLEILVCSNVVKRAQQTLNCNLFHFIKNPTSLYLGRERVQNYNIFAAYTNILLFFCYKTYLFSFSRKLFSTTLMLDIAISAAANIGVICHSIPTR